MSLVIPVRDESPGLDQLLREVPGCVGEIVLVYHGPGPHPASPAPSSAAAPRIRRICPGVGSGGEAGEIIHEGLRVAVGEFVVLIDADGSMRPGEIPHYVHYLESGYDFVKGSRFIAGGDSPGYPLARRAGHRALLSVARLLYGQRLTDIWYGFCAFRRDFLRLLPLRPDGVEPGAWMVVHALHYGLRIAEVPSVELPRRFDTYRLRTLHDGWRILWVLLAERPRNGLARAVRTHRRRRAET
ncbi:glycosyltransferase family 2 protein [Streptomyces sp. NA04227]|nr:glycosyltransferase family 2 protein [Streptomyces sp. NA04227]